MTFGLIRVQIICSFALVESQVLACSFRALQSCDECRQEQKQARSRQTGDGKQGAVLPCFIGNRDIRGPSAVPLPRAFRPCCSFGLIVRRGGCCFHMCLFKANERKTQSTECYLVVHILLYLMIEAVSGQPSARLLSIMSCAVPMLPALFGTLRRKNDKNCWERLNWPIGGVDLQPSPGLFEHRSFLLPAPSLAPPSHCRPCSVGGSFLPRSGLNHRNCNGNWLILPMAPSSSVLGTQTHNTCSFRT